MKKFLLIILLFIPFLINAKECDDAEFKKSVEIAQDITYTNDYNKGRKNYNITIYGIPKNFYVMYNEKKYVPSKNSVVISNIPEGTNLEISIEKDGCGAVRYINIKEKYFNSFYGSSKCIGYEDKLVPCSDEFTYMKITEDYLEGVIYNYNNPIITEREKKVEYVP